MYYYKIGDKICCSFNGNLSYEKAEMPHPGTPLTFLFEREPGTGRDSFKVNSPLLLFQEAENVSWLSSRKLEAQAAKKNCELESRQLTIPPVTTRPLLGSLRQILRIWEMIVSSEVVTVADSQFVFWISEQNFSGCPNAGSCAAI